MCVCVCVWGGGGGQKELCNALLNSVSHTRNIDGFGALEIHLLLVFRRERLYKSGADCPR